MPTMKKSITRLEARAQIADLLEKVGHSKEAQAMRNETYVAVLFTCDLWADAGTVYINEKTDGYTPDRGLRVTYKIDVSWSATGRSVAAATVKKLLQQPPRLPGRQQPPPRRNRLGLGQRLHQGKSTQYLLTN